MFDEYGQRLDIPNRGGKKKNKTAPLEQGERPCPERRYNKNAAKTSKPIFLLFLNRSRVPPGSSGCQLRN